MKKVLSLFLSIIMLLSITAGIDISAYADGNSRPDIKEYNDLYYTAVNVACVSGYKGDNKFLIIPSEIEGKPVDKICNSWFDENNKLQYTSIAKTKGPNVEYLTISDGIRIIDNAAFSNFENLKELYIGKGIEGISSLAFRYDVPTIYYAGTEEEWNNIWGMDGCMQNAFANSKIHYNYEICKHENTEVFDAYDSTCTEKGNTGKILCLDCRKIIDTAGKPIPYKSHIFTETIVAPTCKDRGYTARICDVCGYKMFKDYTEALGHKRTTVITKEATCTAEGEKKHTCSVCKDTWTTAIPKKEHEYEITITEPSCYEDGGIKYKCKTCWRSYWEKTADALDHNYVVEKVVPPSCTCDGYTKYICMRCNNSYENKNYGSAIGHNYVEAILLEPTCTEYGRKGRRCTNCGDVEIFSSENIEPKEHRNNTGKVIQESTCRDNGIIEYTCKDCGAITYQSIPCKEHTYVVKTIAATCIKDGVKYYECSRCGFQIKYETIKATGHKAVTDKAVAATCTTAGKTAGSHCSVCNAVITAQKTVPETGHSYDAGKVTKAATATTAGVKTYTCTKCKATKTETIKATGLKTPVLKAAVNTNGTFTLSWGKIAGAEKYELYIKQSDGSYKLMKTTNATSFTTAFATYGKQFTYKMRAVTGNTKSAYSAVVNATNNKKLQTPTLKVAVNANGTFKLSWNAVAGATSYQLYIKQADGSYKLMKTTNATSFTTAFATYGKQFTYKMRAVTGNTKSAYSAVVNATNTKKLQTPTMKVTVNANGSFTLSWNKVAGATSYQLYIKQADGSYKLMKTTNATSFTTAFATYGKQFTYKMRAVTSKNSSATSAYSSAVNATNNKKLQTPSLKVAVNKNGSFKLSWGKVTGATSYQIYMKQSNGSYKLIKTTSSTSFTTAVAAKGKTYSYKVRAVTGKNKNATSSYSNVVNAKRK